MKDMMGNEMFQHFSTVFCEICLWIIVDSKIDYIVNRMAIMYNPYVYIFVSISCLLENRGVKNYILMFYFPSFSILLFSMSYKWKTLTQN